MNPITLSFAFAFAAVLFSLFYLQKKLSSGSEDAGIVAFFDKIEKETKSYLYRMYRTALILAVFFSAILFIIPALSWQAAASFLSGVVVAAVIVHTSFVFLAKLNTKFAQRTSYGLIESFNGLFGGGNMLGVFILGAVLFFVSAHYILLGSSAAGIISLGLGVLFFGTVFRIEIYQINSTEKRNALFGPIGRVVEFTELFFGALVVAIVAAALVLPGYAGAVALPMLIGAGSILASALSVRLIQMGATTNTLKNITFSISGIVLLSSLIALPLIVWAMNENVQFSNIKLWLAAVSGLAFMGLIVILQYFKKDYLSYPFLLAGIIPVGIYVSYLSAGLYGLSILVVSLISASSAVLSLFIFSHITNNLELVADEIDIPAEQKKIARKLDGISELINGGNRAHLWIISAFAMIGFYLLYQNEVDSRLIQENFSLENFQVIAGMFLSITALFAFFRYTLPKNIVATEPLFRNTLRIITGTILAPALIAILLGAEIYSGFFLGIVVSVILVTVPGSLFDIRVKNNYSAITKKGEILSFVKILGPVSLLLVIFLL